MSALGKRPRLSDRKRAPSRQPNRFTLRYLIFAIGDKQTVGSRYPQFDVVFSSLLNAFPINDADTWDTADAAALCALAMYTLYYFRYLFMDPPTTSESAASVAEEELEDDEEEDQTSPPQAMLTKLVQIVGHVQQIFNFAGGLTDEIVWIRSVQRKFQAAFSSCLIGASRTQAQNMIYEALKAFTASKVPADDWMIADELMTTEAMMKYFNNSPAALDAIAAAETKRTVLSRTASMSGHVQESAREIVQIKTQILTLARMAST